MALPRARHDDAIFRLHFGDGSEAIVYTLLEHKSEFDHRTPLQLIRYVLWIWSKEFDNGAVPDGGLPPSPLRARHETIDTICRQESIRICHGVLYTCVTAQRGSIRYRF